MFLLSAEPEIMAERTTISYILKYTKLHVSTVCSLLDSAHWNTSFDLHLVSEL